MSRNNALHHLWRDAVISTRGTRCECCGEDDTTTLIEAHHVAPVVRYPALAYFVENSAVLCCRCHAHMHSGREELIGRVTLALAESDPARVAWLQEHLSDPCPDYDDPEIVGVLREYLHRHIADGFESYNARYYGEHRDDILARSAVYREVHASELSEYGKAYWEANKDKLKAAHKAYYEANKAKILAQCKAYRARNKERQKKWNKTYAERHHTELLERGRIYRATHKEQIKAYQDAHRAEKAAKERERRRLKRELKKAQGRAQLSQGGGM